MSLLTISYDGVVIHETDESCTLNTEGAYMEGDVEIVVSGASGSISISSNGTYDVTSFASAIVDVTPVLASLTVSQNGSYTPSAGIDGFNNVVVNVSDSLPSATGVSF